MKRVPQPYIFAASARWLACGGVALLLLRQGVFARPVDGLHVLLLSYCVVYTACWTWLLRRWWTRVQDMSLLVLYDVALSALPMWADGWNSAFLPVGVVAVVAPAASGRWRNGLIAAACFTTVDQLILWSTSPTPWQLAQEGQSALLIGRTLLPYAIVLFVIGTLQGVRRIHQRATRRRRRAAERLPSNPPPLRQNITATGGRTTAYSRGGEDVPSTQTVSTVTAQRPATVRRPSTSIPALLRQLRGELDAAGVSLAVQVEGDDARLSPQVKALVARTLEVAVDNVLAHAHARAVVIGLRIGDALAHLEVLDDGVGLWDGTAEPPGFHQIKRLRYRVEEVGGTFFVAERPEGGVAVRMSVPLE